MITVQKTEDKTYYQQYPLYMKEKEINVCEDLCEHPEQCPNKDDPEDCRHHRELTKIYITKLLKDVVDIGEIN